MMELETAVSFKEGQAATRKKAVSIKWCESMPEER